jgi:ribonucleoside-diphosphate reductase alpha chain
MYPAPEITEMAKKTRRIGLGVLGFADMLFQLGIPYSSQEARDMATNIMKTIDETGWQMSEELARQKGVFPAWTGSTFEKKGRKVRNCATTAIAPTGTLSMLADTSGGCEPNFALAFIKNSHSIGETFTYANKHFEKVAKDRGFYSDKLMEQIASQGTLNGIKEVPDDVKKVFEVAFNITAEQHILIQAAFQEHVSNAVSKTINFQKSATLEDVKEGYMLAWKKGCKGCTVYRDGSRENQVLNIKGVNKAEKKEKTQEKNHSAPKVEMKSIESEPVEMASTEQVLMMTTPISQSSQIQENLVFNLNPKQLTACPECSTKLQKQEGCILCPSCGFSACST